MTAALAIGAIDLYQQFVSPHKGFTCAHRVVRGRRSCSQFARRLIEKVGLLRFGPLLMRRLRKCGETARSLQSGLLRRRSEMLERSHARRDKKKRSALDGCDVNVGDCGGCDAPDLSGVGGCDAPSVPLDACDCGGCDLSV